MLCKGSETEWKSESVTDWPADLLTEVGAEDAYSSKKAWR